MSWYPGATRMPGVHAGYDRGRTRNQCVVMHYTVGVNSAGIGVNGYFNFLIRRNGEIVQFAPADAVTWHAGEWNDAGPGIEHEYYEPVDGPHPQNIVTPQQIASGGRLVRWLSAMFGYPLSLYDGPRISEGSGFRGFITHRSLIQSQPHYDYITQGQFAAMLGGVTEEDDLPYTPEQLCDFADKGASRSLRYLIKNDVGYMEDFVQRVNQGVERALEHDKARLLIYSIVEEVLRDKGVIT